MRKYSMVPQHPVIQEARKEIHRRWKEGKLFIPEGRTHLVINDKHTSLKTRLKEDTPHFPVALLRILGRYTGTGTVKWLVPVHRSLTKLPKEVGIVGANTAFKKRIENINKGNVTGKPGKLVFFPLEATKEIFTPEVVTYLLSKGIAKERLYFLSKNREHIDAILSHA